MMGRMRMNAAEQFVNVNDLDRALLDEVGKLTDSIRQHQEFIAGEAQVRREKILTLRSHRITYREIAAAMHVTEQSVYKILRDHITPSPRRKASDETPVQRGGDAETAGVEEGIRHPVGKGGDGGDGGQAVDGLAVFAG